MDESDDASGEAEQFHGALASSEDSSDRGGGEAVADASEDAPDDMSVDAGASGSWDVAPVADASGAPVENAAAGAGLAGEAAVASAMEAVASDALSTRRSGRESNPVASIGIPSEHRIGFRRIRSSRRARPPSGRPPQAATIVDAGRAAGVGPRVVPLVRSAGGALGGARRRRRGAQSGGRRRGARRRPARSSRRVAKTFSFGVAATPRRRGRLALGGAGRGHHRGYVRRSP